MKMKLIAAALLAGVSTAAFAADLPSRRAPEPAPVAYAPPVFSWTGPYIGLQAGYAWDKTNVYWGDYNRSGIVGGAHIGYNFQPMGPLVLGVEGDIEGSSISNSGLRASVRGRAGVAFDRALIYATGGVAWAQTKFDYWVPPFVATYSNFRTGWTVGGGIEYAIAPQWSVRAEYRYSDFGKTFVPFTQVHHTEHAIRLGVSYHFNWGGPGAVVAKY